MTQRPPVSTHFKSKVGTGLNKPLDAIEDANPNTLEAVLKTINFNQKVGKNTMTDSALTEFIQQKTRWFNH